MNDMNRAIRALLTAGAFLTLTCAANHANAHRSNGRDSSPTVPGVAATATPKPTVAHHAPASSTTPVHAKPTPVYRQAAATQHQPVSPYQQPAPGYPQLGVADWFERFYLHLGANLVPYGWGSLSIAGLDLSLTSKFRGGIHLSGYDVITPGFHLGGYFDYTKGDAKGTYQGQSETASMGQYGIGAAIKAGSKISKRAWLGFSGTLGITLISPPGEDMWKGLEISPRIHLDLLGMDSGRFKFAGFAAFGPTVIPYLSGKAFGYDGSAYFVLFSLLLGVTFGA